VYIGFAEGVGVGVVELFKVLRGEGFDPLILQYFLHRYPFIAAFFKHFLQQFLG
jgi:hypothetical protein